MSTLETPEVSTPTFTTASTTNTQSATNGRVKWFNNKAGYGFITVSTGEMTDTDVFVHHSAIEVSQEQYRYLVQGEYVEFVLCNVEDNQHKWQAGNVKGSFNGKLMCETRLETREQRVNHTQSDDSRGPMIDSSKNTSSRDNQQYRVRSRGSGPRDGRQQDTRQQDFGPRGGDEWMLVRRRPTKPAGQRQPSSPNNEVLRSRQPKSPTKNTTESTK